MIPGKRISINTVKTSNTQKAYSFKRIDLNILANYSVKISGQVLKVLERYNGAVGDLIGFRLNVWTL